jgi:hypothetical protein
MLWFQPMPWGRWALVILVAAVAVYIEFRPDPSVPVPFASRPIALGEPIDETNTLMTPAPSGLMETAALGDVATRPIPEGDPVLASDVSEAGAVVPTGWWVVSVSLPQGADVGEEVRLVLLDDGTEVPGVVASLGSDDPFAAADGGVAVPPEESAAVAVASANGRLAVMVSTG